MISGLSKSSIFIIIYLLGGDWNHGIFSMTFQKQLGISSSQLHELHHFSEG